MKKDNKKTQWKDLWKLETNDRRFDDGRKIEYFNSKEAMQIDIFNCLLCHVEIVAAWYGDKKLTEKQLDSLKTKERANMSDFDRWLVDGQPE